MSTYVFETITAAQALAFDRAHDTLVFSLPTATGAGMRVTFNAATATSPASLSVLSIPGDRTVVFGVGLAGGADITFPDGSAFAIGIPGAGSLKGGPKGDGLAGSGLSDLLDGAGGDDVLGGGDGADSLVGGDGSDLFIVEAGDSPATLGQMDVVLDWSPQDRLSFLRPAGSATTYIEATASSFAAAKSLADAQIAIGSVDYVAVQVGSDVIVFADSQGDNLVADEAVTLRSRTLDTIDASNIVATVTAAHATGSPATTGGGVTATISGNLDNAHISHLLGADIDLATSNHLVLDGLLGTADLAGIGLTYDANAQLTGGTVNQLTFTDLGSPLGVIRGQFVGLSLPAAPIGGWVAADATQIAFGTILAGNDTVGGSQGVDLLRGYDGDDVLAGAGGRDTIWGGDGDDTISATLPLGAADTGQGQTYLRGEAGDDRIQGGSGFDDINGNMGDDTGAGGAGDDWVVGGKDNDLLTGDAGADLVYGNIGADTCQGGDGDDIVRGGQGNDNVSGGAGNDYVSGDKGDDVVTGGAGADLFHTFGDAGLDRVTDFNRTEGDRIQLDPGTTYTVAQVGADTVISMSGGQMVLVGVSMSSLTGDWIFVG